MAGKRSAVFAGTVAATAFFIWGVRSGRFGSDSTQSAAPVLMTPANGPGSEQQIQGESSASSALPGRQAAADRGTSGSEVTRLSTATSSRAKSFPPHSTSAGTVTSSGTVVPGPSAAEASAGVAVTSQRPLTPPNEPRPPTQQGSTLELEKSLRALVRDAKFEEAIAMARRGGAALDKELWVGQIQRLSQRSEDLRRHRQNRDLAAVEQSLSQLELAGRSIGIPEIKSAVEARTWIKEQQRLQASQGEWRAGLQAAIQSRDAARVRDLLADRRFNEDRLRSSASELLKELENESRQYSAIEQAIRSGRVNEASGMLANLRGARAEALRNQLEKARDFQREEIDRRVKEVRDQAIARDSQGFELYVSGLSAPSRSAPEVVKAIEESRELIRRRSPSGGVATRQTKAAPVRPVDPLVADQERASFEKIHRTLINSRTSSVSDKKRTRIFLEKYRESHPEAAKDVDLCLEILANL